MERCIIIYKRLYVLFAIPLLAIVAIAFYLGGISIALVTLIVLLLLGISLFRYSPKILLRWYTCRETSPVKHKGIHDMISSLASEFSIPCPKIYLFDSSVPMVFTVGNAKRQSVIISEGALEILDEGELRAVMACEAAKISIGSVPVNSFVALVAGTIISFSNAAMWMSMLAGFGQENDAAPRLARFLAMGLVSLPAALTLHLFSVNSTLRSDELAARVMADSGQLTASLCRIDNYIKLHCTEYFNPGHVNLFMVNPLRVNDLFDVYSSMFMIRPALDERVRLLEQKYENN